MSTWIITDELTHHGVKGMKWGVRKDPVTAINKRIRKEGGSEYSVQYNRFGGTSIRNKQGKKMSGKTQRALEKSIKKKRYSRIS